MAIKANFTAGLLSVTGDNGGDAITVSDPAGQILIKDGNNETVSVQGDQPTLTNTTKIDVFGGNGNDTISLANVVPVPGQATLPTARLFGGNGNDTLIGSAGTDILDGGTGNDTVVGGKGGDTASLGAGNDTFVWNNGDGSDVVEGQAGFDTLVFNGNVDPAIAEQIKIFADVNDNGRATLFRTQGAITMDLNSVERIELNDALGGTDNITINDLTGTDVKQVAIDLGAGTVGGGDGQADTVSINATNGHEITVADNNGVVTVSGLASTVTIANFEEDVDHLVINGQSVTVAAVNSNNTAGTSTASDGSQADLVVV
ncbi:MAG: calcium-binding protein, partial [Pseudolabrys sp.]